MALSFNASDELFNSPYCFPSAFQQNAATESHSLLEFFPGRIVLLTGMGLLFLFLFLIRRQVKTVEETYQMEESVTIPNKLEPQNEYFVSVHSTHSGDNLETMKKKIPFQDENLKKLINLEIKLTELEKKMISKYGNKTLRSC